MASLQVSDLIEELNRENSRLLSELKSSEKCVKLLQSYRKCLLSLSANCKCNSMVNNNVMITILENEYKSMFAERVTTDDITNVTPKIDDPKKNINIDLPEESTDDQCMQVEEHAIACSPSNVHVDEEEDDEEIVPDMPQKDDHFMEVIPNSQHRPMVVNGSTENDPRITPKMIYRIIVQGRSQDKVAMPNNKKDKKLFECEFPGCLASFNSLKRLANHNANHNFQPLMPETPLEVKHRHNERQRRQRFSVLFAALLKEMPHLNSRPKTVPNREILDEAQAYINQLEERNTTLIHCHEMECLRQESLQKSLKQALNKLKTATLSDTKPKNRSSLKRPGLRKN